MSAAPTPAEAAAPESTAPEPASERPARGPLDRGWFAALLALLVFASAYVAAVEGHGRPPDNTDEEEWIAISLAHVARIAGEEPPGVALDRNRGALDPNPWRQGVLDTTFGWANPGLAKIVWGVVLRSAGHEPVSPYVFYRYHNGLPSTVAEAAKAETRPMRRLARQVVAGGVALTAAAVCLLARAGLGGGLAGLVAGLAAAALFSATPLVRLWSFYVRPDFLMLALVAVTGALAAGRARWRRARPAGVGFALALGAAAGLATATKLNGALAAVFAGVALPIVALATRPAGESAGRTLGRIALGLAVAGAACLVTFLALYPTLRDLAALNELLEFWERHLAHQQERMLSRGDTEVGRTLAERIALGTRQAFESGEPLTGLLGLGPWPWGPLFVGLGLTALAARALGLLGRDAAVGERAAAWCALAWVAVVAIGTTVWIPIDWDRYLFPYAATAAVAEGALLATAATAVTDALARVTGSASRARRRSG